MATFYNQATLTYNGATRSSNLVSGELLETLVMTKSSTEETYITGSEITYAVSLINTGTTPFDGITITDDLGAYTLEALTLRPLDYVDGTLLYYINGALAPTPTVSTDTGDLVISGINVPAGGNAMLIYVARANNYAPPTTGSTVVNTATATGGGLTPVSASHTLNAAGEAELSVVKSVNPQTVSENGSVTYTFTVYNIGNTETSVEGNPVITDTFDPVLSNITVTLDGAALAQGTGYSYNGTTGVFSTADGVITVPAATFTQDQTTGEWTTAPGTAILTVSGTV